jgi:hypothetical protein
LAGRRRSFAKSVDGNREYGYDQINTRNGKLIGERAASSWLYVTPFGIRKILNWLNRWAGCCCAWGCALRAAQWEAAQRGGLAP